MKMKFTEGEQVLAKNPKSSDYLKAKILSIRGEKYKIQLIPSGVELIVDEMDIKAERMSRSTVKTSPRSKRKVTSRNSPSRRSPSRKSPSRKSPSRRSLSRNKQGTTRSARLAKVSIPRIDTLSDDDAKNVSETTQANNLNESAPLYQRMKEFTPIAARRSMRLQANAPKLEQEHKLIMLARNIDRAVSLPIERKSHSHEFPIDGKERDRGFSVQRDKDKQPNFDEIGQKSFLEKRQKEINFVSEPQEWGGKFGALGLIFILPLSVILPQLICSNNQCKTAYIDIPLDIQYYLSLETLTAYLGFLLFLAVVSFLPVGRYVDGQQSRTSRLKYRMNGFSSAVLSISVLAGWKYNNLPVDDFILQRSLQFSISGWFIGTILSLILYIRANKAPVADLNIYASTNSSVYNFWQGREINPRIGSLDLKLLLARGSIIGMIIINSAIIMKCMEDHSNYNSTAVLGALLQLIYALDFLIFESNYLTTFGVMYEGTGYMLCVGHLLYPFLQTLMTRVLLHENTQITPIQSGLAILGFITSYIIFRWSNWQKGTFRNNPLTQSLSRLQTIPTSRGKKLLASGWWGMVRHPNYLGDILIQCAVVFLNVKTDPLPYYALFCSLIILMHRAIRDNKRCKLRYESAWDQYCSQVKYMIFKGIF